MEELSPILDVYSAPSQQVGSTGMWVPPIVRALYTSEIGDNFS